MSSNTASSPAVKAPKAKTSKVSTTSTKKAATKKSMGKTATTAHPSWKAIITECITVHKDQARTGVSRQLLKKFASDKYRLEPTPANIAHLNHAIAHGAENGIFLLPKGPSGRVKLSAAGKSKSAADENTKPASKPSAKSTKVVKVAAKSTKPKPTTATKKTSSTKTVKKTAAAKSSAAKSKSASAPKSKSRTAKATKA